MLSIKKKWVFILLIFIFNNCEENIVKKKKLKKNNTLSKNTLTTKRKIKKSEKENFYLNDKNAIPFLYEYSKKNKENKVRIITKVGNIDILLYEKTPYHRANFIFLVKQKYFDGTYFHRIVKNFIIQGGNSDKMNTAEKRRKIGRYLLPPDTKKGFKHHRGTVSMPSSKINNPYKLASPYEFFIVQQKPGSFHLDGSYTAFGKVIHGMDIVEKISQYPTDNREAPLENIIIKKIEIIE